MNLLNLQLFHFRNYERASFEFQPGRIHILQGGNAQGKTNLIEAIYWLSNLRSFRTNDTEALIEHGQEGFVIEAKVENDQRNERLKASVSKGKKSLFHFDNPVRTYSSFVGLCNAILFCPEDLNLFTNSPRERRRFLDMEMSKLSRLYTRTLAHYQKILKERNAALKLEVPDSALLSVLTGQMIQDQVLIIAERSRFLRELIQEANRLYPFFADSPETIGAEYKTFVSLEQDTESELKAIYEKDRRSELYLKSTLHGVHKDNIVFTLNGLPVSEVASQGQKRSILLAIKLGLAQLIKKQSGQYPILLLDDVFSELDPRRKRHLMKKLPEDMQIFITSAEDWSHEDFGRKISIYNVEKGKVQVSHE